MLSQRLWCPEDSSVLPCWFLLFAISLSSLDIVTKPGQFAVAADSPLNDIDAMGSFKVGTAKQCEKICWYHRLCSSFSYYVGPSRPDEDNCVLHASSVQEDAADSSKASEPNWNTTAVTPDPYPSNGCSGRPCNTSEICYPTLSQSTQSSTNSPPLPLKTFDCIYAPAVCPESPEVPANSTMTVTGHWQNDEARVSCDQHFVLSPNDTDRVSVCQVNSLWTSFAAECMQYEWFHVPLVDIFTADFPLALTTGWGMCLRGVMPTNNRLFLNFLSEDVHQTLPLQVDLRPNGAVYDTFTYGKWVGLNNLGTMPLQGGDSYILNITATEDHFRVEIVGEAVYRVPLLPGAGGVNITSVTRFRSGNNVRFDYVNVIDNC